MELYSKKNLSIAGIMAVISLLLGFLGQWLTQKDVFTNISLIGIGLTLIYFSHDLTMERVVKYKVNYKFGRGMYIFIGFVFIVTSIIGLINDFPS